MALALSLGSCGMNLLTAAAKAVSLRMRPSAAVRLPINSSPGMKASYWSATNSSPRARVRSTFCTKLNRLVEPGSSGADCDSSALPMSSSNRDRRSRPLPVRCSAASS